jgi:hypothetical protein
MAESWLLGDAIGEALEESDCSGDSKFDLMEKYGNRELRTCGGFIERQSNRG